MLYARSARPLPFFQLTPIVYSLHPWQPSACPSSCCLFAPLAPPPHLSPLPPPPPPPPPPTPYLCASPSSLCLMGVKPLTFYCLLQLSLVPLTQWDPCSACEAAGFERLINCCCTQSYSLQRRHPQSGGEVAYLAALNPILLCLSLSLQYSPDSESYCWGQDAHFLCTQQVYRLLSASGTVASIFDLSAPPL